MKIYKIIYLNYYYSGIYVINIINIITIFELITKL